MMISLTPGWSIGDGDGHEDMRCDGCGELVGRSGGHFLQDTKTGNIFAIATEGPHHGCEKRLHRELREAE